MTPDPDDILIDETFAEVQTPAPCRPSEPEREAAAQARRRRGLTIRLKLTIWTGLFFALAGALLIGVNYFMVHDSMTVAPGKVRALIAERHGLTESDLSRPAIGGRPGVPPPEIWIIDPRGGISGYVLEEALRELRDEALHQLWTKSLIALAIIAVLTFGLAWIVAGRMLRPVHQITSAARRLSGSTLHERIGMIGPRDELKDLADTFDEMLERLDAAFTAQKEFVANASHELRTPLTIIRTELDVAMSDPDLGPEQLHEMGVAINEAVDRSEGLIDGLLTLANAERTPTLVDLDLAEVAMAEVDLASGEADAMGLQLELDLQSAPVKGEKSLLQRMVGNLVENAVRHNRPGGWFLVKTYMRNGYAVLEVANSGSVISPDETGRLFERFYRPDKSRSRKTGGFGLGLSIVKSVVTALGGTIELEAPETGGLRVMVSLPAGTAPGQGSGS